MTLTVLSDENIQSLLSALTREDILKILTNLSTALSQYSSNPETPSYASRYQPQRTSVTTPEGQLTLFMPFTSATSIGTKIIGLAPSSKSGTSVKNTAPKGVVTLLDSSGTATGLLNAEELTAFRTSLSSMILFQNRQKIENIVVFGAGKQALWHIRLALLLRGPGIMKITIVNRSTNRSDELLKILAGDDQSKWGSKVEFEALDPLVFGYWQRLEGRLEEADVVFCCTPSARPLFPARYLASEEKLKAGCYVTAIGSHNASMAELDPVIFMTVVKEAAFHPTGGKGGAIVVDSRKSCLLEAGEIIQGKIEGESLVDVGEIVALGEEEREKAKDWLENGFLIYKCVGIAVMDAAVASDLVDLARSKGVGVSVPDF